MKKDDKLKAFYRPTTLLNRIAAFLQNISPIHNPLTDAAIKSWQKSSYQAYLKLGAHQQILDKILTETAWEISDNEPPQDVWFGEAKFDFDGDTRPKVIVYTNTVTTRLILGKDNFAMLCEVCMDHIFGHLYEYYSDQEDYGEEIACANQHKAAKSRKGWRWTITSSLMPLFYKLHKNIPLANFR